MFLQDIYLTATGHSTLLTVTVAFAVVMGLFLLYDKVKLKMDSYTQKEDLEKKKLISRVSLGGVIAIVMKADGRPTKAELGVAKDFLRRHYPREHQLEILHHIKRVLALKRPNTAYYVNQLNLCFNYQKRMLIVEMLYEVASFNGGITPEEWALLNAMMAQMHFTLNDQQAFRQRYHSRIGSTRYQESELVNATENSLKRCYHTLGLQKGATLEEVKHAYRKLVKKYHPDRLTGVTDETLISTHTRKFREVTQAYEELMEVME